MQRVMIIGQSGSGKSTLARKIGAVTGLPVFHMDHIHWKAGWVERTKAEKTELCQQVHAKDAWIFEGTHSATWSERLVRSDLVIWLDFPIGVRLRRVFMRSLRYRGRTRPDLTDGCPERLNWSFFAWIWNTRKSGRVRIEHLVSGAPPEKRIVTLSDDRAVRRFLKDLGDQGQRISG